MNNEYTVDIDNLDEIFEWHEFNLNPDGSLDFEEDILEYIEEFDI